MISSDKFSVTVIGSDGVVAYKLDEGRIVLREGEKYSLQLANKGNTRCDAFIKLEDESISTWRIESGRSISVDDPRFVFHSKTSAKYPGVMEVKFVPEYSSIVSASRTLETSAPSLKPIFAPGLQTLGLISYSLQKEQSKAKVVDPIKNIDVAGITTIKFRLVASANPMQVPNT